MKLRDYLWIEKLVKNSSILNEYVLSYFLKCYYSHFLVVLKLKIIIEPFILLLPKLTDLQFTSFPHFQKVLKNNLKQLHSNIT